MSSTYQKYDPASLYLEYIDGEDWSPLAASSITLTQSYDVDETGVLTIGIDSLAWNFSAWIGGDAVEPLPAGSVVRLRYDQPGVDTLLIAVVTSTTYTYSNPDSPQGGLAPWRADFTSQAISRAAYRLQQTITWDEPGLPAEAVSVRLARWLDGTDLHGATDATMPAETGAGSTTLMEIVRAASLYLGRPARLVDTGSSTQVEYPVQRTTLPDGPGAEEWESTDWQYAYSSGSLTNATGGRRISTDSDDADLEVGADLVTDDVRLIYSDWKIPDPLPVPWRDPAAVTNWTMTFTPKHCTGSVAFSYAVPGVTRPRPPVRYTPGRSDTTPVPGGLGGGSGGTSAGIVANWVDGTVVGAVDATANSRWLYHGTLTSPLTDDYTGNIYLHLHVGSGLLASLYADARLSDGTDLGEGAVFANNIGDVASVITLTWPVDTTAGMVLFIRISGHVFEGTGTTHNYAILTWGWDGATAPMLPSDSGGGLAFIQMTGLSSDVGGVPDDGGGGGGDPGEFFLFDINETEDPYLFDVDVQSNLSTDFRFSVVPNPAVAPPGGGLYQFKVRVNGTTGSTADWGPGGEATHTMDGSTLDFELGDLTDEDAWPGLGVVGGASTVQIIDVSDGHTSVNIFVA